MDAPYTFSKYKKQIGVAIALVLLYVAYQYFTSSATIVEEDTDDEKETKDVATDTGIVIYPNAFRQLAGKTAS